MPFEIFTAHHNVTLSQVASLSRMNLRSPYTDAILADSDVPTTGTAISVFTLTAMYGHYDCSIRCHDLGNQLWSVVVSCGQSLLSRLAVKPTILSLSLCDADADGHSRRRRSHTEMYKSNRILRKSCVVCTSKIMQHLTMFL